MNETKYVNMGSIINCKNSQTGEEYKKLQLNPLVVSDLIDFLSKFEEKFLANKDENQIKAGLKDKTIPRIDCGFSEPKREVLNEMMNNMIYKNVSIKANKYVD